jgi:DNA-binding NarL/FixJ family response regulator
LYHWKIQEALAEKYRILIVEDEPLIAEDLVGFLEENNFHSVGVAHNYDSAIEKIKTTNPQAVLLDINLGEDKDGIDIGREIRENYNLPFIYLTSYSGKEVLERAKKTRPNGYLLKPFDGRDVMTSLEIAIYNHLEKERNTLKIENVNRLIPVPLSPREYDLLLHLREGKTNKEIAQSMCVSVNTVKTHLLHLYEKLDVTNRTQAIFRLLEFMR